MDYIVPLIPFFWDGFGIKQPTKIDIQFKKTLENEYTTECD